jgi:hypothetical protein
MNAKASNMMFNAVMGLILNTKDEYTFWSMVLSRKGFDSYQKLQKPIFLITHQKCGNNKKKTKLICENVFLWVLIIEFKSYCLPLG